jgi:hypothetical protein
MHDTADFRCRTLTFAIPTTYMTAGAAVGGNMPLNNVMFPQHIFFIACSTQFALSNTETSAGFEQYYSSHLNL